MLENLSLSVDIPNEDGNNDKYVSTWIFRLKLRGLSSIDTCIGEEVTATILGKCTFLHLVRPSYQVGRNTIRAIAVDRGKNKAVTSYACERKKKKERVLCIYVLCYFHFV